MPDDYDYAAVAEILARPLSWTPQEEALIRHLKRDQERSVEGAHPLDNKGRAQLERFGSELSRAIAECEAKGL